MRMGEMKAREKARHREEQVLKRRVRFEKEHNLTNLILA